MRARAAADTSRGGSVPQNIPTVGTPTAAADASISIDADHPSRLQTVQRDRRGLTQADNRGRQARRDAFAARARSHYPEEHMICPRSARVAELTPAARAIAYSRRSLHAAAPRTVPPAIQSAVARR
jgi:hypothetical protein